jgi:hemerythrin superfamily protein
MDANVRTDNRTITGDTTERSGGAVETLLREHQEIKSLLDRLTSASREDASSCVEELKSILVVHNATEENLIYPALRAVANEHIEPRKLYFETAEADILLFQLDEIAKNIQQGDFTAKAEKFAGAVREHIDSEEKSAFPHLKEKTSASEMMHLDSASREFRNTFQYTGRTRTSAAGTTQTGTL